MQATKVLKKVVRYGSIFALTLLAACSGKDAGSNNPASGAAADASAVVASEPVHALVTVPANAAPPADFNDRFTALRQAPGALKVLVLQAQPSEEPAGFQTLAIVDFKDEPSLNQWMAQTQTDTAFKVRRADVLTQDTSESADATSSTSFYVVNHYEALVTPQEYRTYTEKYIVPNMANQKSTGAMLAYTMYIEREPEGVKPLTVLVKQYVSPEEHLRAEEAKENYKRDVLLKQPEWKQINDTKSTIRNDLTETLARPVS